MAFLSCPRLCEFVSVEVEVEREEMGGVGSRKPWPEEEGEEGRMFG